MGDWLEPFRPASTTVKQEQGWGADVGRGLAAVATAVLVSATATSSVAGACPVGDWAGFGIVDWAPVFVVGGDTYYPTGAVVTESKVGDVVEVVDCQIGGRVNDPGCDFRDGDAAYLAVGTSIQDLDGSDVELAVLEEGQWQVYAPEVEVDGG